MSTSHLPSFLAAAAERLQAGSAVVGEGVAWRPPFEGAGFTSCVKPALRGGVTGKLGEGRVARESAGTYAAPLVPTAGQAAPADPAVLPGVAVSSARNIVSDLAGDAASVLDEQWKTREMAAIALASVQATQPPPEPDPTSRERIAALLAPPEGSDAAETVPAEPAPATMGRFAAVVARTASVEDSLSRLGAVPSRGAGSAELLREMIATLANRDSTTMRSISPPPRPANTAQTRTEVERLTSLRKMPPPLPASAGSGSVSQTKPTVPNPAIPILPGSKR